MLPTKDVDLEKTFHILPKDDSEEPMHQRPRGMPKPFRYERMFPQLVATIVVSWLSIIVGYASGYSSPAEHSLLKELNITKHEGSWICSLLPVGAFAGSLSGGPLIEYVGRKRTLVLANVIFSIAWTTNYFCRNYWTMYGSRVVAGYSVGITSFTLPIYVAETVKPKIRGRLGLFPSVFGNLGILMCYIIGMFLEWRGLALVALVLTSPFFIAIWFVPETPRWHISKGHLAKAEDSLRWLRGRGENVDKELEQLVAGIKKNRGPKLRIFSKLHVQTFCIVLGLMFFQQFSGINALIFYTEEIFAETGSSMDAFLCSAIIGIANFLSTFMAALLVDKTGRKVLLYISTTLVACMLLLLGVYFYLMNVKRMDTSRFGWIPLVCFIIYVLGFSLGMGPIPWLLIGEMLPSAVRGPAASICAAFSWACTFVITKTFPFFVGYVGAHYLYWFFSVTMFGALLFVKLFVPETNRRSLESIEEAMGDGDVR